jgi:DnaJ-class molecular chaperone
MTIPSKGMPFFNDDMLNGNLFVRFFIEFPEKITSDLCQKLI